MLTANTLELEPCYLERRRSDRFVAVMLIAKMSGAKLQSICRLRNISATGAQIETNIPLIIGQSITIELRSDLMMTGHIRWQEGVRAGIEFEAAIELSRYLTRTESRIDRIKARAPRYQCYADIMVVADCGYIACQLTDISMSGAGLSGLPAKVKLRPNHELRIIADGLLVHRANIAWVESDRLGLKFQHPIKYPELREWLADYSHPTIISGNSVADQHAKHEAFHIRH